MIVSVIAVEEKIRCLGNLSREELARSWSKTHGNPPPKGIKYSLLERNRAYQLQVKIFGKLKISTTRTLLAIANGQEITTGPPDRGNVSPGMRLIREWHGVTHRVEVTVTGFDWNEQSYTSLSAVAFAITGARWSGPRFFGL